MKDVVILAASPRRSGNTNWLVREFTGELDALGKSFMVIDLYDLDMKPCMACRECQREWERPACALGNDELFAEILDAKAIMLATPIYSWYCTAPAKAFLDRCVYAMNKYYGVPENDGKTDAEGNPLNRKGPSLWEGRKFGLITTCGYPLEKGADLLEEGIKRYCAHSKLEYVGAFKARHMGYNKKFQDDDKKSGVKEFARRIMEE